jgi:hypothetical protein
MLLDLTLGRLLYDLALSTTCFQKFEEATNTKGDRCEILKTAIWNSAKKKTRWVL